MVYSVGGREDVRYGDAAGDALADLVEVGLPTALAAALFILIYLLSRVDE
jgi:hypothetical protein